MLTPDEVRANLAQCSRRAPTAIRDRARITVMYRAGLRIGEALALKASDVDMRRGAIRVRHDKGDRSRTVALVVDGALAVLQLWLDARRSLGLARNGTPLFCTLAGGTLSDDQVRTMINRRAAKAGIEKRVHPHALRHSHAFELAQRLGHPASESGHRPTSAPAAGLAGRDRGRSPSSATRSSRWTQPPPPGRRSRPRSARATCVPTCRAPMTSVIPV